MLLTSTTTWLSLFILGVSALFFCPYPGLFFITNNQSGITLPVCFIPVSLPVHTPDLRNEIPYQSISLMIISHISCYNCCNLIFLLSWCHSPFIYHFRRDALNQGPLLKSFFFANQLPATPYKPSLCLLFTGAWHAPVIRSSSRIFTNESSHAFHTYPNTLVLPFPVLPRLVLF